LPSLNKISFADHLFDASCLDKTWGGVFFHPDFIRPACEALGLDGGVSSIVLNKNQVGASNILVGSHASIRAATLPLLFQYYGVILFEPAHLQDVLVEMDNYLSRQCDFAYLSFPPDVGKLDGLSSDWKIIPNLTLALRDDDLKMWGRGFKDDVKNKIRKASREKVIIAESGRLPVELWTTAYTRKNMNPPIAPAALERWCQDLIASSLLRIFVAQIDNQDIAFRGELILGNYAYDWIAGSSPEHHASGANQLLMAEIGQKLLNLKCATWDLVGGEVAGIADFKKSFGAKEYPYLQASRGFGLKGKVYKYLRKFKHG
jgi:hypothetical protein